MQSLLGAHAEQLKWPSKREKPMVKAVGKRVRGAPEPGAPAPATGHSPRILFPTAFPIDFLRSGGQFGCSVWVLGRDGISAHIWYGLRTNLGYGAVQETFSRFLDDRSETKAQESLPTQNKQ